jgi:uncharacterized SAM-binding protein YcdF (DUF218 family)
MRPQLFKRQTIWFPTWFGLACSAIVVAALGSLWFLKAEPFFSTTDRKAADVLVVEGWIDAVGIQKAAEEFRFGGYRYIVATGGLTGKVWDVRRWDYSQETEEQLLRLKIPRAEVIRAPTRNRESQRTFEMAAATWRALREHGIKANAINVFTRATHARRSRLVFSKVFGPEVEVGVIAWLPPSYEDERWWESSERADDIIKETVGYFFELLVNSGRRSNSPEIPH